VLVAASSFSFFTTTASSQGSAAVKDEVEVGTADDARVVDDGAKPCQTAQENPRASGEGSCGGERPSLSS
jgi:hypothetical protein